MCLRLKASSSGIFTIIILIFHCLLGKVFISKFNTIELRTTNQILGNNKTGWEHSCLLMPCEIMLSSLFTSHIQVLQQVSCVRHHVTRSKIFYTLFYLCVHTHTSIYSLIFILKQFMQTTCNHFHVLWDYQWVFNWGILSSCNHYTQYPGKKLIILHRLLFQSACRIKCIVCILFMKI